MKNLVRGLISLSYTDREINEFDDFFIFFAVFWQTKIEIESLIPITSIIIHLLYTQSPHDGLCKIRIGRNQIYTFKFFNEKIFILAKMCVFSRKCVFFNGLCRRVKMSR